MDERGLEMARAFDRQRAVLAEADYIDSGLVACTRPDEAGYRYVIRLYAKEGSTAALMTLELPDSRKISVTTLRSENP